MTCATSFLKPNQFKLVLDKAKYPYTSFLVTSVSLPSVSGGSSPAAFRGVKLPVDMDTLEYEPLNIRLMVDENLYAYREMFDWMVGNRSADIAEHQDISLVVLSSHNNETNVVTFHNARPTNVAGVQFENIGGEYLAFDVTFEYTTFTFN